MTSLLTVHPTDQYRDREEAVQSKSRSLTVAVLRQQVLPGFNSLSARHHRQRHFIEEHLMQTRRDFIHTAATGLIASSLSGGLAQSAEPAKRKRLAIVTTVFRLRSHGQHMGDRFLVGYPQDGRWHQPGLDVVSMYVDQKPKEDLSQQRAEEFKFRLSPSIADALRCGGNQLAVDAVLVIGEHGDYPDNEFGQRKYPRYEFFKQIVDVFKQDGRCVPIFNDKHLSWNWAWAKEMVDTAKAMNFPLMAGSSLPVTWRMPTLEIPAQAEIEEAMCVAYGGLDSYDFHALEVIQCMVERRRGGETGVTSVQAITGDAFWKAHAAGSWEQGGWSPLLFESCLARSQQLAQARDIFNHRHPTPEEMKRMVAKPTAFRVQYRDGLRTTMFLLNGLVSDFTFAAKLKGQEQPLSTLFHLPPGPNVQYSAMLMSKAEEMFLTGKATTPVERTLLTSGILAAGMQSISRGKQLPTPHLNVQYSPL